MLLDRGRVDAPWDPRIVRPTEEQAREVFAGLHRNMYEAFTSLDKSRVYDLLAVSVAAPILDRTYAEIFESLIQRTEGGAISLVEDVEVLEGRVELDAEDDALFEAEWHWLVRGVVTHWGHQHRRTNRYRARYLVQNDGRGWKIAAVDVLDVERMPLDEGE